MAIYGNIVKNRIYDIRWIIEEEYKLKQLFESDSVITEGKLSEIFGKFKKLWDQFVRWISGIVSNVKNRFKKKKPSSSDTAKKPSNSENSEGSKSLPKNSLYPKLYKFSNKKVVKVFGEFCKIGPFIVRSIFSDKIADYNVEDYDESIEKGFEEAENNLQEIPQELITSSTNPDAKLSSMIDKITANTDMFTIVNYINKGTSLDIESEGETTSDRNSLDEIVSVIDDWCENLTYSIEDIKKVSEEYQQKYNNTSFFISDEAAKIKIFNKYAYKAINLFIRYTNTANNVHGVLCYANERNRNAIETINRLIKQYQ